MNNETQADILAEMRTYFQAKKRGNPEHRPWHQVLSDWADRLEAATVRERDPLAKPRLCKSCKHYLADGCEICGCCDYVKSDTIHPAPAQGNAAALRLCDELIQAAYDADICSPGDLAQRVLKIKDAIGPSPKPGNAAALREALEQVFAGFDNNVLGPIGDIPNDWEIAEAKRLCKVVEAALSSPPRNCDVGTPEEQWDRFSKHCRSHDFCSQCPVKPLWNFEKGRKPSCGLLWAQIPYTSEGGKE